MSRRMRPLSQRLLSLRRSFATTTPRPDAASHRDTLEHLKQIDSIALAATKRQVNDLGSIAQSLSTLSTSIISSASTVKLNPNIPAYKPWHWAHQQESLPACLQTLDERIARLRSNIEDLEIVNYRDLENGEATRNQKFRQDIARATEGDKKTELQMLKFQESAVEHRCSFALEGLEGFMAELKEQEDSGIDGSGEREGGGGRGAGAGRWTRTRMERRQRPNFKRLATVGSGVESDKSSTLSSRTMMANESDRGPRSSLTEAVKTNVRIAWGVTRPTTATANKNNNNKDKVFFSPGEQQQKQKQQQTLEQDEKKEKQDGDGASTAASTATAPAPAASPTKANDLLTLQAMLDKSLKS